MVWFGVCTWLDVAEDLVHIVQILGPGAAHADDVIADSLMQLADHFLSLPESEKTSDHLAYDHRLFCYMRNCCT